MRTFRDFTLGKAFASGFARPGQLEVRFVSAQPQPVGFLAPAPGIVVNFIPGFQNYPNAPKTISLNLPQNQPLLKSNKTTSP